MKRLLLVGAIAVAGSLMIASAAAINFPDSPAAGAVGAGSALVEGFDVTNVEYDLLDTDPLYVDKILFNIEPEAGEVQVQVNGTGPWTNCTLTPVVGPPASTDVSCDIVDINAEDLDSFSVAATS